jgi:elongation of very long chain fatty acids protein 6
MAYPIHFVDVNLIKMKTDIYQSANGEGSIVSKLLFFEREFDADGIQQWSEETKSLSVWFSAIYILLIFGGQHYMKDRQAFNLRLPLITWNIMLAVFSLVGAIRTVPELLDSVTQHGWSHSVCSPRYFYGTTGFWAYAFTASKVIELGDTMFIVLRKQQLIFLHWYHHVTVLVYCFYSFPEHVSSGRWYMVMNYCVHSIMYGYFALRALRFRIPSHVRISVTSLQIIQMMIGLGVVISAYFLKHGGTECHQSYNNMALTVVMYVSYLVLFLNFFHQEYSVSEKKLNFKRTSEEKVKLQ